MLRVSDIDSERMLIQWSGGVVLPLTPVDD